MVDFESAIINAIETRDIPGCALVCTNRDGSFNYAKAFGKASLKEGDEKPMQLDTLMWVASCTKLMTSICAMQLVERGLVSLDEPVYKFIPELESFNVLKGFDDAGKPIEEKHTKPITLRHLLTHSSGLTYDAMHPSIIQWLAYHKREAGTSGKILERFFAPLVFEPGESWTYGPSIDYAGLLIERISGKSLEEYMKANLWEPLGVTGMTFFPDSRPDLKERLADMSVRDETGKVRYTGAPMNYRDANGEYVVDCMGGQGSFTSAGEYLKIIQGLLTTDENEKILKKESVGMFFSPQLGEGSSKALNMVLENEMANNAMGGAARELKKDYALGGVVIMSDSPDGKKSGTLFWGGLPNLIWWVDRKAGLCGLYAGQVLPPGDAKCAALNRMFEAGMYEQYQQTRPA